jgi:hypothetical protein
MTSKYYVGIRPQTNAQHAVHREECPFLPEEENRICLGSFNSAGEAVMESRHHYSKTKGCLFCSIEHNAGGEIPILIRQVTMGDLQIPVAFYHNLFCCLS